MKRKIHILNIASILPVPDFGSIYKLKENDFLIVLKKHLHKMGVELDYLKVTTYSNRALAKLNDKWEAFYKVPEQYYYEDILIRTVKSFAFPNNRFKALCSIMTLQSNKKKLCRLFKENNYSCIHAHSLLVGGYLAYYLKMKFHVPYVLTIRNETKYLQNPFLRKMAIKVLENANVVLTTNRVNKESLEKYTNHEISIITHGVDEKNLYFDSRVNNTVQIVTACRLIKGKRIDLLIEALKGVADDSYMLNVIGDGPEFDRLQKLAEGINCKFWGELEHSIVIDIMKKSDIFVLPSEYESFGRVYIEALASSNAVIAVKDTGVHGLFKNNEEILYMERNSVGSLCTILTDLIKDHEKIRSLKINGYKSIENNYSWDSIAAKYYEVYIKAQEDNRCEI